MSISSMASPLIAAVYSGDDTTLVSEDGHELRSNRQALSRGSDFFRAILARNCQPDPVLYVKGVSTSVLKRVVEFLHVGVVAVGQGGDNSGGNSREFREALQMLRVRLPPNGRAPDDDETGDRTSGRGQKEENNEQKHANSLLKEEISLERLSAGADETCEANDVSGMDNRSHGRANPKVSSLDGNDTNYEDLRRVLDEETSKCNSAELSDFFPPADFASTTLVENVHDSKVDIGINNVASVKENADNEHVNSKRGVNRSLKKSKTLAKRSACKSHLRIRAIKLVGLSGAYWKCTECDYWNYSKGPIRRHQKSAMH